MLKYALKIKFKKKNGKIMMMKCIIINNYYIKFMYIYLELYFSLQYITKCCSKWSIVKLWRFSSKINLKAENDRSTSQGSI
jgi:hypothetical protein